MISFLPTYKLQIYLINIWLHVCQASNVHRFMYKIIKLMINTWFYFTRLYPVTVNVSRILSQSLILGGYVIPEGVSPMFWFDNEHWNEKVVKLTALGQSLNLILNDDYPGIPSDYPGSQLECRGSRKLRMAHAPFLASGTASVADILFTDRQSPIYGNPLNPRQVLIFESGLIWHHCFRITPAVFCNVFEISKLVLEATKICERSGHMPNQPLTFRGFISLSWKGVL